MNNKKIIYEATKTVLTNEDGITYNTHGIRAILNDCVVDEILDVSTVDGLVADITKKLNDFDVRIEHFRDIVYDCLCV